MRFIDGKENDSDPFNDYQRLTGSQLKKRGVTVLRLDHGDGQRPRGSSAKSGDVDIEWKLTRKNAVFSLTRTKGRQLWIPERIDLVMSSDPLTFTLPAEPEQEAWPDGAAELADLLDELDVPLTHGRPRVQAALKEAGHRYRAELITAAIRYRKAASEDARTVPGTGRIVGAGTGSGTGVVSDSGTVSEQPGTGAMQGSGTGGGLIKSPHHPARALTEHVA